jgi:hypothetical protein
MLEEASSWETKECAEVEGQNPHSAAYGANLVPDRPAKSSPATPPNVDEESSGVNDRQYPQGNDRCGSTPANPDKESVIDYG